MTSYASQNFLTRRAFKQAVAQGLPIVLFSPDHQIPAINGPARVCGPWPGTKLPVDPVLDRAHGRACTKPRERLISWHLDVLVLDMRVVAVVA